MGAKNAFLNKIKTEQKQRELLATADGLGKAQQAMFDSIILTLGYGSCMGEDVWGEKRIMAFLEEVRENYQQKVFPGIEIRDDADGFRGEVDKLLQKKCPGSFLPWEERYPFWNEETIEQEAERNRKERKRKEGRK